MIKLGPDEKGMAGTQVSRRVRDSLTQTQRRAVDKRFLARFEKEREVGFAMLRVGACTIARSNWIPVPMLPQQLFEQSTSAYRVCQFLPCLKPCSPLLTWTRALAGMGYDGASLPCYDGASLPSAWSRRSVGAAALRSDSHAVFLLRSARLTRWAAASAGGRRPAQRGGALKAGHFRGLAPPMLRLC